MGGRVKVTEEEKEEEEEEEAGVTVANPRTTPPTPTVSAPKKGPASPDRGTSS
jgi:hypothetical protein